MAKGRTAIFFLIIFLYNSVGYYFIFKAEEYQVKEFIKAQIKRGIPGKELILLSFDSLSAEFRIIEWIEEHEFRYKGQMFDVVKQSIDATGIIHYYCINDKQEQQLYSNLDEEIKRYSDQANDAGKSRNSFKKDGKDFFWDCACLSFQTSGRNTFSPGPDLYFNNAKKEVVIPPPKSPGFLS